MRGIPNYLIHSISQFIIQFVRKRRMAASSRSPHSTRMHQAALHQPIDSTRWNAVVARDRAAAGAFVYAVRSTGVYCRPGCASRRPRRDRVTFFDTPDEAEGAGFRPCRRCRPRDVVGPDPWVERIRCACVYLANVDGHLPLASLARRLGGSPYHLQRNFKRIVGITPRQYAEACRLQRVKQGLRGRRSVTDATLDAGFGSSSRLYERAVPKLGMTPSTYRRGGEGAAISFTTVESPMGRLLVAATPRGVCRVSMGRAGSSAPGGARTRIPEGRHHPRCWRACTLDTADSRPPCRSRAADGSPAGHPGDGVPVAGLAGACRHPVRLDANLRRGGSGDRAAAGGPRRGACLRGQPGRARDSVPPRRPARGRSRRLSVGSVAKEGAAGFGAPPPGY